MRLADIHDDPGHYTVISKEQSLVSVAYNYLLADKYLSSFFLNCVSGIEMLTQKNSFKC